jgi:hypothetical protein
VRICEQKEESSSFGVSDYFDAGAAWEEFTGGFNRGRLMGYSIMMNPGGSSFARATVTVLSGTPCG